METLTNRDTYANRRPVLDEEERVQLLAGHKLAVRNADAPNAVRTAAQLKRLAPLGERDSTPAGIHIPGLTDGYQYQRGCEQLRPGNLLTHPDLSMSSPRFLYDLGRIRVINDEAARRNVGLERACGRFSDYGLAMLETAGLCYEGNPMWLEARNTFHERQFRIRQAAAKVGVGFTGHFRSETDSNGNMQVTAFTGTGVMALSGDQSVILPYVTAAGYQETFNPDFPDLYAAKHDNATAALAAS